MEDQGGMVDHSFKKIELLKDQSLGHGSYGKVYKAKCDGIICAAKLLHETLFEMQEAKTYGTPMERFMYECQVLNKMKHPNIVQYLGTHTEPGKMPILLMEMMDSNLTKFLERSNQPLPYCIQVNICHDIALALSFLHSNNVVHRDLSGNNVLMFSNTRAKLSDFGMAKLISENPQATVISHTACPGTRVYMPPEALKEHAKYTKKIDCFSFGVVVVQVLTREFPEPGDQKEYLANGSEAPISENIRRKHQISKIEENHPLRQIACDCLCDKGDARPCADNICERIAQLKETQKYINSLEMLSDLAAQENSLQLIHELHQKDQRIEDQAKEIDDKIRELDQKDRIIENQAKEIDDKVRELVHKDRRIENQATDIDDKKHELDQKDQTIENQAKEIDDQKHELHQKDQIIKDKNEEIDKLNYESTCKAKIEYCISHCGPLFLIGTVALLSIGIAVGINGLFFASVNQPLNAPLTTKGPWRNESLYENRLWGSYRSNVYFGMRPRIARSLLFGMMWFMYDSNITERKLKHVCERDDVDKYEWEKHDGTTFGQQIIDDEGMEIKTDFVTTSNGWIARINGAHQNNTPQLVSFIFYLYNEGDGKMKFNPPPNSIGRISGSTPEFENFRLRYRSVENKKFTNHQYLSVYQPQVTGLSNYMKTIMSVEKNIAILPGNVLKESDEPNLMAYQITCYLPFEIYFLFENGPVNTKGFSQVLKKELSKRKKSFDVRFESVFKLKQKGSKSYFIRFAKATLSNLLGSISYFYGSSRVRSKDQNTTVDYWPAHLYTAVPSRAQFPRGFLWNEGFHQLLLVQWDTSIVKDVLAHWLDLMNTDGWIPREQILGDEARSKVPDEFVVQHDDIGNPPTFFLTLKSLINHMEKTEEMDLVFLKSIYPRLEAWFDWFNKEQSGSIPHTYRWRGRDENTDRELNAKTHASGFDDYPRASHPTIDERHVDLRCWMALASEVMTNISDILGYYVKAMHYRVYYHSLSNQISLDELHWDPKRKQYSDYGLHTSSVELVRENKTHHLKRNVTGNPTKSFVNSFGYVSLFPFFLKLISPNSEKLGYILKKMGDKDLLWTDYGLRSLSKDDPFYDKANTKDDPPYWRGSIWINMNYLACRALHYYGNTDGVHKNDAATLYQRLRSNLINNVYSEYNRTGYVWESYDDMTGKGKGTPPYTGWSSLIILIMAEKYD